MKTINLYDFNELSPKGQDKAVSALRYLNVEDGYWSEGVLEECKNLGFELFCWDIDNIKSGRIRFTQTPQDVAANIMKMFTEEADIYHASKSFLESEYEMAGLDSVVEKLEDAYAIALAEAYTKILRDEHEYSTSREAVISTIEANDMWFFEDGALCKNA